MKKKIELSIIHVIIYILAFLLVAGMLFYKTCLNPYPNTEITQPEQEIQLEQPIAKEKDTGHTTVQPPAKQKKPTKEQQEEEIAEKELPAQEQIQTPAHNHRIESSNYPGKSVFHLSSREITGEPTGRCYYKNEAGSLESIIIRNEEGIAEILIAKDLNEKEIDRLEISKIDANSNLLKYATFTQNRIRVFENIPSGNNKDGGEIRTEYLIRPNLQLEKGKSYSKIR